MYDEVQASYLRMSIPEKREERHPLMTLLSEHHYRFKREHRCNHPSVRHYPGTARDSRLSICLHIDESLAKEAHSLTIGQVPTIHSSPAYGKSAESPFASRRADTRRGAIAEPGFFYRRWERFPCIYAVWIDAAPCKPSSSTACLRIKNFWILPETVMGKLSTNLM